MDKKAQGSMEYLIIVGFVTFVIIGVIVVAYIYTNLLRDKIAANHIESFAKKVVSSAESVFYAGEPSKSTIEVYLPEGVQAINIAPDAIVMNFTTGAIKSVRAYYSNVNMSGSISPAPGTKKITLEARSDYVYIHQ